MVTYLSPSYTPICTRAHTYTVCFADSPSSYTHTYIYIHIYSVSPHRVKYLFYRTDSQPSCIYIQIYSVSPHRVNICITTQMAQFNHTGETKNLDGELIITTLYTHMYTHTHKYTVCFTDNPPSDTYIYIYTLFHHTELSICFTAQIAHHHSYIYIYIHIL